MVYTPGTLLVKDARGRWLEFERLRVYQFRGKRFAILGTGKGVTVDKRGRRKGALGCTSAFLVYDDDGDGKFETIRDLPLNGGPALYVPKWVLQQGAKVTAGCGYERETADPDWFFIHDPVFLERELASEQRRYVEKWRLPRETTERTFVYKKPGVHTRSPHGGIWEFRGIVQLSYRGRPFAVISTVYHPGKAGGYLPCSTIVFIYDEDGDGRFETLRSVPEVQGYVPRWALEADET